MLEESMPSIWASMNSWLTPTVLFVLLNLMIGTIAITSRLATHNTNEHKSQQQEQERHGQPHPQLARSPSMLQRLKSINFYNYNYRSQEPTSLHFEKPQEFDTHFTNFTPQPQQEQYYFQPQQQQQSPLSRSPSMLQRLKSINLYSYLPQEIPIPFVFHRTQELTQTHFAPQEFHGRKDPAGEEAEEEEEEDESIQDQEETLDEIYSKLKGNCNRSKSETKPRSREVPTKLMKMKKSASAKSAFAHFEEDDIVETRRPATAREAKSKAAEVDDVEVDAKADDFINNFKHQLKLQRIDSIMRHKQRASGGSAR